MAPCGWEDPQAPLRITFHWPVSWPRDGQIWGELAGVISSPLLISSSVGQGSVPAWASGARLTIPITRETTDSEERCPRQALSESMWAKRVHTSLWLCMSSPGQRVVGSGRASEES